MHVTHRLARGDCSFDDGASVCGTRIGLYSALKSDLVVSHDELYVHFASRQSLLVISSTDKELIRGFFRVGFLFPGIPGSVVPSSEVCGAQYFLLALLHTGALIIKTNTDVACTHVKDTKTIWI